MSAYLSLHYHVVFSTKHRVPCPAKDWRDDLHSYMSGTIKGLGGFPQTTDGWFDHVHLLFGLKATHVLADVVRELKKASSVWMRDHVGVLGFAWQEGYAAITVGHREREIARAYIDGQEEHHRARGSKEELLALLGENGIEFDPRYFVRFLVNKAAGWRESKEAARWFVADGAMSATPSGSDGCRLIRGYGCNPGGIRWSRPRMGADI